MKFFIPLLILSILLQSCDAFTDKRAVTKEEFYKLKDNVTITKVTEGQILETATPKAQQIYKKVNANRDEVITFLENTDGNNIIETQNRLFKILELDSTEIDIVEKIAYYQDISKIEYETEKQIFEAYQNISDTTLYQENLQILHGKEKILYNYPSFETTVNNFDGIWSIVLNQKAIIRLFNKNNKKK